MDDRYGEDGTREADIAGIQSGLKPCPHCGPMPAMPELVLSDTSRRWQVFCGPCGSSSGSSRRPEDAAAAWNSRHVTGPEIGSNSPAVTMLALLLGNSIEDLSASTRAPIYGFKDDATRQRAYVVARDVVLLINARNEHARTVEDGIGRG